MRIRLILSVVLTSLVLVSAACASRPAARGGAQVARTPAKRQARAMLIARPDPRFSARIVSRRPLLYAAGADPAQDRPAFVRAASGLAWIGERIAVVQDDAHFIALVEPESGRAEAIPLPADAQGRRLFDDARGLKHLKHDLEACFAYESGDHIRFVALGSGTKRPMREHIVTIDFDARGGVRSGPHVIEGARLYALLRAQGGFSGSELNLEGALVRGTKLLLVQRGNGAPGDGRRPISAIGQVSLSAFEAYLAGSAPPPELERVQAYELGRVGGVPYAFTDATVTRVGDIVFLASAEGAESTVDDGAVRGTIVGQISASGIHTTPLRDEQGRESRMKAEGIVLDRQDPTRAWIAVDVDDPSAASELLEVRLARQ